MCIQEGINPTIALWTNLKNKPTRSHYKIGTACYILRNTILLLVRLVLYVAMLRRLPFLSQMPSSGAGVPGSMCITPSEINKVASVRRGILTGKNILSCGYIIGTYLLRLQVLITYLYYLLSFSFYT